MEKVINQAKPYGILYTVTGQEYFLLKPAPNAFKDSWQHDHQQRFTVVKREWEYDEKTNTSKYVPSGDVIQVICTNPTIELCDVPTIEYESVLYEEEEFINQSMTEAEMEEYEKQQLRFNEIFEPA